MDEEAAVKAKKASAIQRAEERSEEREKRIAAAAAGGVADKTSTTGTIPAVEGATMAGDNVATGAEGISPSQVHLVQQDQTDNRQISGAAVPTEETAAPVYHEQDLPSPLPTRARSKKQVKGNPENSGHGGDKSESSREESVQRSGLSLERGAIERAKKEINDEKSQAEEGLEFVKKSVDMADLLRGFAFTRHGIPVRDIAKDRDGLLQGRSVLRERYARETYRESEEGTGEGGRACGTRKLYGSMWLRVYRLLPSRISPTHPNLPRPCPPMVTGHDGASERTVACYHSAPVITPPAICLEGVSTTPKRLRAVTPRSYH